MLSSSPIPRGGGRNQRCFAVIVEDIAIVIGTLPSPRASVRQVPWLAVPQLCYTVWAEGLDIRELIEDPD